ncbi:hypothetical protein ACFS2C_10930 [Prauserella oleivorans]|uniref:Uncharacterized protein n=1 Tax=Prauserella oleivorans TaxID=1478153 RepID=A0ABW5W7X8_9PSEU
MTADAATGTTSRTDHTPRTATVRLPFVTAEFRAPDVHLPRFPRPRLPRPRVLDRDEITAAARTAGTYLPSPRKAAYFGGLAVLAALEVIEWPVALAIGVGTAVAAREGAGQETGPRRSALPQGETAVPAAVPAAAAGRKRKPAAKRGTATT